MTRVAVALVLITAVAVGCLPGDGVYHCTSDTSCVNGDVTGMCQPTGYCSFPDNSCPNGRYGALSGALANQCVSIVPDAPPDAPPQVPTLIGFAVGTAEGSATTMMFAMTVPPGSNELLIVSVELSGSEMLTPLVDTITYAGETMTRISAVVGDGFYGTTRSEQWDLIAPPIGNAEVVIQLTSPGVTIHGNAMAFAGIDQTSPIRDIENAYGSDNTSSTVSVMSGPYDLVESTAGQGTSISGVVAPATLVFLDNGNGSTSLNNAAGATSAGVDGSAAVTWMYGGPDIWQEIVASLRPVP